MLIRRCQLLLKKYKIQYPFSVDKYSKQMENKLYKEVIVTDRLPQSSGYYLTNNGKRLFSDHINVWQHNSNEGPVEWWLEVVTLDHIKDKRELTATFLVNSIRLLDEQGARHLVKELCERFHLLPSQEDSRKVDPDLNQPRPQLKLGL